MHTATAGTHRVRIVRRDNTWTFRESEVLKEAWPDVNEIARQLPMRSQIAIRRMAKRCGLVSEKPLHIWTGAEDKKMKALASAGTSRKAIASELGLSLTQIANRMRYTKTSIRKRPPIPVGDPLVTAIRQRAFELNISLTELDRSLGKTKWFANGQRVPPKRIGEAVKALGGKLSIEWLEQ